MAAGEYVSVSSQADTEKADLRLEARSLEENEALRARNEALAAEVDKDARLAAGLVKLPDADRAIVTRCRQLLAIGGKGDAPDRSLVAHQNVLAR